jgi:hypothetical protein
LASSTSPTARIKPSESSFAVPPRRSSWIEGAVVSTICDDSDPAHRTQVLIGANRVGPGGGSIEGIRILHDDGFLEITDYTIVLCDNDLEYCEEYGPTT